MKYYDENLKSDTIIVDLCSSWISHLPNQLNFKNVIGMGMNEKELEKNKKLNGYHVQDLNKDPQLKMIQSNSVDSVLCTVSVDYLTRVCLLFTIYCCCQSCCCQGNLSKGIENKTVRR